MKVVIAGGSGFIGRPLVEHFLSRGADVAVLSRSPERVTAGRGVKWSPGSADRSWVRELADATHVINLAGENIGASRWTPQRKEELLESRLTPTRALVEAMKESAGKPAFLSTSAIGYYGNRGDEELTEISPAGTGFLSDLTKRWEEEARNASCVARVAIFRLGIVLAADGGALEKMLLPFRLFAGGKFGSGEQWMSWIDREDVVRLFDWAATNAKAAGSYNATAPGPVRNREFARLLGRALHRPAIVPTPEFALRTALGEMAGPLLIDSAKVLPMRATRESFTFSYPTLGESLIHSLASNSK